MSTGKTAVRQTGAAAFNSRRFWIIVSLLTVYIIWGTTYLAIRFALESFSPYLLMGLRFVMAGGLLFIVLRINGAPLPTLKQWRGATIVGFLLLVCGMGSVARAEQTVSSGLAASLIAVAPLLALLFSMLWGARPSRSEWIGVGLGMVGVIVLTMEGNLQANPAGVALILFATTCWSFGSVWLKHLEMPPGQMANAAEMLAGGGILCLLAFLGGDRIPSAPTTNAVLALAYLTTFGSLATISAYTYLLKTVSPALATSYAFVNPAIALLLGVLIGGEILTGSVVLALPLIFLGIGFVFRESMRRKAAA